MLSVVLVTMSFSLYDSKQLPKLIVLTIIAVIVAINAGFEYHGYALWIYFALAVGAKGVNFRNIIKFHLSVEMCFCLANFVANYLGWTDSSHVFTGDEREDMFGEDVVTRFSAGYPAATDFATHVLYMLLDCWILKNGKLRRAEYALIFFIIYALIAYCDARQASVCVILIILCSLYLSRLEKNQRLMNKWIGGFMMISIPFFFFFFFFATMAYDSSDIGWLVADAFLSGRLGLGLDAIEDFGIPWLGQTIKLYGAGFAGGAAVYNYVDCAYIQLLLRWGIIVMAIFLLSFVSIGMNSYKRRDYVLLFSLFVAGVSAVITQFLFYLNYSVFIFALTAIHESSTAVEDATVKHS